MSSQVADSFSSWGMSLSARISPMSQRVTSSDHVSKTASLTVLTSVVEKPCRQKRRRGGVLMLNWWAVKVTSGEDHMRWDMMIFFVSSEKLYAKKLRGCSSSSLMEVSGHGGDTFTSGLSLWTKFAMSMIALRRRSTKIGPLTDGFFPSWSKTLRRSFGCGTFNHAVMTLGDWKSKICAACDK